MKPAYSDLKLRLIAAYGSWFVPPHVGARAVRACRLVRARTTAMQQIACTGLQRYGIGSKGCFKEGQFKISGVLSDLLGSGWRFLLPFC